VSIILLGKKKGMARLFNEKGEIIPVSVIELENGTVVNKKTSEKHGYEAIQLGFLDIKENKLNKPESGYLKKSGISPKKYLKESRIGKGELEKYNIGDEINISYFSKGDYIDVSGKSIGKGFAGGVKRWGWHGGDDTHGSMFHRAPGSVGASAFPSRTYKGHRLPGRMGGKRVTVQSLLIVDLKEDLNLIIVKGALPGPKGSYIEIRKAKKKAFVSK